MGDFGKAVFADVHVLTVLADAGMDVHTAACFADSDFWGKGYGDAVLVA